MSNDFKEIFQSRMIPTPLGSMNWLSAMAGAEADLLLIHGMIVSSSYMVPTAARLAQNYNVFVPDLLGRGLSDTPETFVSIEDQAKVLAEAIEGLGLKKPIVAGGSQGAHVAVELANQMEVGGLIFIGPTRGGELRDAIGRLSADAFREPPELVCAVMSEVCRIGIPNVLKLLDDTLSYPFHERLKKANVPTLLIMGEHDPFYELEFINAIHEGSENVHGICIRQTAHGLPFSEPEIIGEYIHNFVQSIRQQDYSVTARAA